MTDPASSAAARAALQALKMSQATTNPLVAIKHGRREDRAVVYDRFLSLCVTFYRLRLDRGPDLPERADELFAALYAIQLRAPRHVRAEADRLFWRIVGGPSRRESLYRDWLGEGADTDPFRVAVEERLNDEAEEAAARAAEERELWDAGGSGNKLEVWLFRFRNWRPMGGELIKRRAYGFDMFTSGSNLLDGIADFAEIARIDVHNRWRWWHWPMALIPPLKRWQLTR